MFDEETQQAAKVNTADLCEDLGQVEYLFTDKTCTLTENRMVFKHFAIDGHVFTDLTRSQYEAITAHSSLIVDNNNTHSTSCRTSRTVLAAVVVLVVVVTTRTTTAATTGMWTRVN